MLRAVSNHVDNEPLACFGWENISTATQVFLNNVVLCSSPERAGCDSAVFSVRNVETKQPGGRRIYRHGRVHLLYRDFIKQDAHLTQVVNRDPNFADFADSEGMVRVVSSLGWQIECDR